MSAELAREAAVARTWRARVVLALGPVVALAGIIWAIAQPWRITLLDPDGQGLWWLFSEPPLYVLAVGILFRIFVAPGLVEDMGE